MNPLSLSLSNHHYRFRLASPTGFNSYGKNIKLSQEGLIRKETMLHPGPFSNGYIRFITERIFHIRGEQ